MWVLNSKRGDERHIALFCHCPKSFYSTSPSPSTESYAEEGSRQKHCSQVDVRENCQEDVASSLSGQHAKLLQTCGQF